MRTVAQHKTAALFNRLTAISSVAAIDGDVDSIFIYIIPPSNNEQIHQQQK